MTTEIDHVQALQDIVTIAEFAEIIRKSERQATRIAKTLPHYRLGRRVLLTKGAVDDYIASCRRPGASGSAPHRSCELNGGVADDDLETFRLEDA